MKRFLLLAAIALFGLLGCSNDSGDSITGGSSTESESNLDLQQNFRPKIILPSPNGPTVTVAGSVDSIFTINGATQTVTFDGTAADFDSAWYTLSDEYGQITAGGSITVGSFSVPVQLSTAANANDTDGRLYVFTVTAVGNNITAVAADSVVAPYSKTSNNDDDDDDDCGDHDGDDDDDDDDDNGGKDKKGGKGNKDHHNGKKGHNDHNGKGGRGGGGRG